MEWIREPMEVNMTKSVSWCPCMGAKCRGNNPPFCSIKTSNCKILHISKIQQIILFLLTSSNDTAIFECKMFPL